MVYFLFILGFLFLIKGADFLVEGASSIAKKFNVSNIVIGLTIVSLGTSMPELIVNVKASFDGSSGIAIGNVIGSNISNIFLILGISALIYPLLVKDSTVLSEIPYSLIAVLLVAFLANANLFEQSESLLISRIDGVLLLLFFGLFILYIVKLIKMGRTDMVEDAPESDMPTWKSSVMVGLGIVGLWLGGEWVVEGAKEIGKQFNLKEDFIGLTIVAIGTSLPELVTSAMAALKKNTDIAVANVVGSNIFNILWVLGLSSAIRPLNYDPVINADILVLIAATCCIIFAMATNKKNEIGRLSGVLFILIYIGYIAYLINRL